MCALFVSNCRHGPGSMMYGSGDVYEGLWANDQKHGHGSYFYMARGKRFDGVWQVRPGDMGAAEQRAGGHR